MELCHVLHGSVCRRWHFFLRASWRQDVIQQLVGGDLSLNRGANDNGKFQEFICSIDDSIIHTPNISTHCCCLPPHHMRSVSQVSTIPEVQGAFGATPGREIRRRWSSFRCCSKSCLISIISIESQAAFVVRVDSGELSDLNMRSNPTPIPLAGCEKTICYYLIAGDEILKCRKLLAFSSVLLWCTCRRYASSTRGLFPIAIV